MAWTQPVQMKVKKHTTTGNVLQLQKAVAKTLSAAFSDKYNASNTSVYNRYLLFVEDLTKKGYSFSPVQSGLLWIQHLDSQQIIVTSAGQYLVNLAAALRIFEGLHLDLEDDRHLWSMFRRSLARAGSLKPLRQAPPILFCLVVIIINDTTRTLEERVSVLVGWLSAARGADLRSLTTEKCSITGCELALDFTGVKNDPFKMGLHCTVEVPEEWLPLLQQHLTQCEQMGTKPFTLTSAQITALLRLYDESLSGHSIRRGSLQHLLERGATLAQIQQFGRYRSEEALLHYLPAAKLPQQRELVTTSQLLHRPSRPSQVL